jgi:uncharacterized RDD family membrane protein YckC
MEPIGVGLRSVATIIDTTLLMVVAYMIAMVTGGVTAGGFSLEGAPFFLWLLVAIGYYTGMEASAGATIGKFMTGLRVVRLDSGSSIDLQSSLVRNVLRVVDGLFFYLVAAIAVWTSDKKQRIGDRVAGTMVVRAAKS